MHDITRRDFLNGVALTIASGLTPAAQIAAQPSRYPPALTGMRGHHAGSFEVGHDLRDGKSFSARRIADRGALRPGRGRRRHQRACGRMVLPAGRPQRAHPDPRQPRRFRRARQAQRIPPRWPSRHRLWRQQIPAVAAGALQPGRQGPAESARRRCRAVQHRVRAHALSLARAVARRVLSARSRSARTSSSPATRRRWWTTMSAVRCATPGRCASSSPSFRCRRRARRS